MLTKSSFSNPDVERLIKQIDIEHSRYERDLRSIQREKIVLPVEMKFMNGDPDVFAITRNLSPAGVCIIANEPFGERMLSKMRLHRLNDSKSEIIAECKWCRPFGTGFWMSGWQFLRVPRH